LITTVAGTGTPGLAGDGAEATSANVNYPVDLGFDGDGNLYILELGYYLDYDVLVRKVDPAGRITTVVGPGAPGDAGRLLLGTTFGATGMAVDVEGNVYMGGGDGPDVLNKVIRVDTSGTVTTIAGTGQAGFSGDGGPATEAKLANVWDVAVDDEGNLYISADHRIRKVDTSGVITTIAGTGVQGFSGDGGLAVAAQLNTPHGIAVGPDGNIVFADAENQRIRRLDAQGVITTIVGNGEVGFSGDGGPATDARIHTPEQLWVDDEGNIYVADTFNRRIRKIDTDGIITTVVGNGTQAFSGDGGPATSAGLAKISGVAVGPDGALYIADSAHDRVRKVVL
jgi:internalin A